MRGIRRCRGGISNVYWKEANRAEDELGDHHKHFLICVRVHSSIILELGEPNKISALTRVGVFACPLGLWDSQNIWFYVSMELLGQHEIAYRRDHKDSSVLGGKPSNLRVDDGFHTAMWLTLRQMDCLSQSWLV